jgi:hypothetical protein
MITAMVVLAAASGAALPRDGSVTSATVGAHAPDPGAAAAAADRFRAAGFEVGNIVGVAFSVTGEPALFEKVFGYAVEINDAGEPFFETDAGSTRELPAAGLPDALALGVEAVVFSPAYDLDDC